MSYAKNITMIEDLPDINEMEQQPQDQKYQKFLRSNMKLDPESGMSRHNPPAQEEEKQPQYVPQQPTQENFLDMFSCLNISRHVQACPICSKFYNTDKTLHVVIIIVLVIVCLLLLKKNLNL